MLLIDSEFGPVDDTYQRGTVEYVTKRVRIVKCETELKAEFYKGTIQPDCTAQPTDEWCEVYRSNAEAVYRAALLDGPRTPALEAETFGALPQS